MSQHHVQRDQIVDIVTYEDLRPDFREQVMAEKSRRRVHLGVFTFLFENALTIRYQVQEMMRVERIVRESSIIHELQTYNELLGEPGELGCTLLIEILDPEERDRKLTEWLGLPEHLYARMEDDRRIHAQFDARQVGEDRLSSVHYLRFDTGAEVPVAIGVDFPGLVHETALTPDQRSALTDDFGHHC